MFLLKTWRLSSTDRQGRQYLRINTMSEIVGITDAVVFEVTIASPERAFHRSRNVPGAGQKHQR
jgi:hypothetical protein